MTETIICRDQVSSASGAVADGDALWLSLDELRASTGWEITPQGACRGDDRVSIPAGREAEFLRDSGRRVNLGALARLAGQPVAHDVGYRVWYFGEPASARRKALQALQAPDFRLPDLDGRMHALSDYRGRKVFLVSWASW